MNETPPVKPTLGRYRLIRRIGHGGMGEVWLAEDPSLHRQVAIKTLPARDRADRQAALRFAREARAIAALHHPHILPIHDYGEQEQPDGQVTTYLVMPYIQGGSLAQRIALQASGIMPYQEAISYLIQAAEAIDYAHQQGIVHRDVKPENLLLREDNWLQLADFGIAYRVSADEQGTTSNAGFGTPDYMAPEQAQGRAELASDLYSLAVIAYRLLSGRLPFHGETSYATVMQHITMPPPSPREFNPALPLETEAVLLRGLAKAPTERPASARAFVAELQQSLAAAPFAPTFLPTGGRISPEQETPPVRELPQRPFLTRRNVLLGSAALLAAGAGVSAWAVIANEQQKQGVPRARGSGTPASGSEANPLILPGHNQAAVSLAWSPKAQVLASASGTGHGQIFLWDIQRILAGQTAPQPRLLLNQLSMLFLSWSPDGKALAVGPTDVGTLDHPLGKINVYTSDLSAFAPGYNDRFVITGEEFFGLAWLAGNYLATMSRKGGPPLPDSGQPDTSRFYLRLWKFGQIVKPAATLFLGTDISRATEILGSQVTLRNAVAVLPGTTTLACMTSHGLLVGNLDLSANPISWHPQPLLVFDSNPLDNALNEPGIASGQRGGGMIAALQSPLPSAQGVTVWTLSQPGPQVLRTGVQPVPQLTALAWSPAPTDTLVAAGSKGGSVYIWDATRTTLPIKTLTGPAAAVSDVAWSADGAWLAASYSDPKSQILVWRRQEVLRGY